MRKIRTELLEIAFEEGGPKDGSPVLLLHGWPDAPRGWKGIAARLQGEGWRTIAPYLRGSKPTRFLSEDTPRTGSAVALAQDAIELADALGMEHFAVVGHDWGARTAYTLAALFPHRISSITALSVAFQPRGEFKVPDYSQSRRFWYQWFQCVDGGAEAVRRDPIGFARIQWDTWSPPGWFDEAEFAATAESFTDPDWLGVTLNAYRARWLPNKYSDARYTDLQKALSKIERLSTPTLMIQGGSDFCDAPEDSEGLDEAFTGEYRREVLDGVGHFPHREAADRVGDAIVLHLDSTKTPI